LIVKVSTEKYETLFHRHSGNPILTGKDWPYSTNSVFNAGATLLPDGSTVLLCRVEDRRGLSHLLRGCLKRFDPCSWPLKTDGLLRLPVA
jgi:predicted GH43/DUF377 family glycosyl hydrolase